MKKDCGVLLHITSLPGNYGIGTLGESAYKFIDYLKKAGFSYWEILPLEATEYSNSPYLNSSAFGYNFELIDLELLIKEGLLTRRDLKDLDFGKDPRKINFSLVYKNKKIALRKAFKRFDTENPDFIEFKKNAKRQQFVLYSVIKECNNDKAWFDWSLGDRYYDEKVIEFYQKYHADDINYQFFVQYEFMKQRNNLHNYAKKQGIDIIGDISHFIGYDSDEMYFNPSLFLIDKRNLATVVAGFPPDDFKKEGQKWGYPLYDWDYMKFTNYKWWKEKIYNACNMYDRVKLNHFRGFLKVYAVPFRSLNAKKGEWLKGPGLELFNDLECKDKLIASHLGRYSKDVDDFVIESKLPYLRTCLNNFFATEENFRSELLPSNIEENLYLYLGNHDNLPARAIIKGASGEIKNLAYERFRSEGKKLGIPFDSNCSSIELLHFMIQLLLASKADHVTFTFQDLIFSGEEARTNTPGTDSSNNWSYRFLPYEFAENSALILNKIISEFDR